MAAAAGKGAWLLEKLDPLSSLQQSHSVDSRWSSSAQCAPRLQLLLSTARTRIYNGERESRRGANDNIERARGATETNDDARVQQLSAKTQARLREQVSLARQESLSSLSL